ncbi:MAG: hypothetical protein ABEH40_02860 [Haloferacaceae archaeon]
MPDTKEGRERKGKNKRLQRVERLYAKELELLDDDEDLPEFDGSDADLVADDPAVIED